MFSSPQQTIAATVAAVALLSIVFAVPAQANSIPCSLRRLRPSPPPLFIRFGCDGSSPPCLRYDFDSSCSLRRLRPSPPPLFIRFGCDFDSFSPVVRANVADVVAVQLNDGAAGGALLASDVTAPSDEGDKEPKAKPAGKTFSGNVSWYGPQFQGKKTASGRMFDMNKLTCAHRTLPFGTRILVENPRTGQSVIVEVIDRGPYAGHRVMDLSREAARRLGILLGGLAFVQCTIITK